MSFIFYDYLLNIDELNVVIKKSTSDEIERHELWGIVDEIVHHNVLECIFSNLPKDYHIEFAEYMYDIPYDHQVLKFLDEKIGGSIETLITERINEVEKNLMQLLFENSNG